MSTKPLLTLLSWNIFRNYRPERIRRSLERLIEAHRPDVVFIQEAPERAKDSFYELEILQGFHRVYAPVHEIAVQSRRLDFRSTGQLTLSRLPFEATAIYELPALPRFLERKARISGTVLRRVPYARLRMPSGISVGIHNVHLENRTLPSGRSAQVRHVLRVVNEMEDDVDVVGGDLNTFMGHTLERCLRLFSADGFSRVNGTPRLRGLPSLDYVMVRGAAIAVQIPVVASGSDHHPVVVKIEIQ